MEHLWPKTGNPLAIVFGFSIFLLILCLPNVSNKYYHITVSDKFSAQHKEGPASIAWEYVVSAHGEAMA